MSTIGNLVVNFLGNTKPLQASLSSVKSMVGGFAGTIAGLLGAGVSIEAAREDIAAQKKLQAVLNATGYSAGLTAMEIRKLATDLQGVTNFADETTVAAAAVLATFRSIKGDQFKETLKVAQDLATVFDMDLQSATIKLGKALQDPIQGIGSLHKVGISFTEDQKKMIKTLVEAGDTMGAKYILDTLKGSFGGAAEAMASPFKILQNLLNDIGEEIGKSLLVPMKALASATIPFLRNWGSELAKVALAVLALVGVMRAVTVVQKGIAVGQALILALGGPAGWTALAAGAAVFAASLAVINTQFGEMQAGMDAMQGKFAQVADAARRDAAFFRELGDKPPAEMEGKRKDLIGQFAKPDIGAQMNAAEDAFGGFGNVPWFVREGIVDKISGVFTKISDLKGEINILNGKTTETGLAIAKMWSMEGVGLEQKREFEDLMRKRDALLEQKKIMEDMTAEAKRIFEATRTPGEKMESQVKRINELFAAGKIDAETRDRAIAQANEDALKKDKEHPINEAIAANEIGSQEAFANIFAAMRTGQGQSVQDKILDANVRVADAAEKIDEGIARLADKPPVEFIAGVV